MKKQTAVVLALCMLLAGCGSAQVETEHPAAKASVTPVPTATAAPAVTVAPVKERPHYEPVQTAEVPESVKVTLEAVDSSCFSRVGYDSESETLAVEFHNTGLYYYYGVPESVYKEFRAADSLGGWYNRNIKGSYECEKIG